MRQINYHHLRYFWVVAREGSITRASRKLRVAASALSTQVRLLEAVLGEALFERDQKALTLTEAGRVALNFAETIFGAGEELLATFARSNAPRRQLKVGAMATLSRNFQLAFLRPALEGQRVQLTLQSGPLPELLTHLEDFTLDLVLSTQPVSEPGLRTLHSHLIAEYPVSLIATPRWKLPRQPFPHNLADAPLLLPGRQSLVRAAFEAVLAAADVRPLLAAEVDDMAMLRLLAREGLGIALVPPVVVQDELRSGKLRQLLRVPGLQMPFYAITAERRFPHPVVSQLLTRAGGPLLRRSQSAREERL